jgi:hypothetical protein
MKQTDEVLSWSGSMALDKAEELAHRATARAVKALAIAGTTLLLSACAGVQQQAAQTKARGTIESGGYTWTIPMDTEGAVQVQTTGLPTRQAATEVGSRLCKKYGRVAQFVRQTGILMLGVQQFEFNCVK